MKAYQAFKPIIPSVNFHLWQPCNMRCKFCFATFMDVKTSILPKGHLTEFEALEVVKHLAYVGFEKITFAGGEPTLCPWLPKLIATAKQLGLTTMIVTNGNKLNDDFFKANRHSLDWIAISIDSLNESTNIESGRAISGKTPLLLEKYKTIIDSIKQYGYGLKINTVIHSKNFEEDMSEFILYSKPERWKLFQMLPMIGQNDLNMENFKITDEQFHQFITNHEHLNTFTTIVSEDNNEMTSSYAMVDPAGRFFENTTGAHTYSNRILEVGGIQALEQMGYNFSKFIERGGIYDWNKSRLNTNE